MTRLVDERALAAWILREVIDRKLTTDQSFGLHCPDPSALLSELVYGCLRHYYSLMADVDRQLAKAPRRKDLDLKMLMLVGAYQLRETRIPDYVAIDQTVSACGTLRKPWAKKLVNGVLRNLQRRYLDGMNESERSFELPAWIVEELRTAYPAHVESLMTALQERAPMCLRINVKKIAPVDYMRLLNEAGLPNHPGWLPASVILESPVRAASLPGFSRGLVSVQDSGAMFASTLFPHLPPGARLCDACAAPGGKLFHLAEALSGVHLTGIEISQDRMTHLQEERTRLNHPGVGLITADVGQLSWWPGEFFDGILLDAPCSGSGTLRRHPDIKVLREPSDLEDYARMQRSLLDSLWQTLRPGGTLIYCTCSLFPTENDEVISSFLTSQPDASILPVELPTGVATSHGWQLLPLPHIAGEANLSVDGFYYARLSKAG